MITIAFMKTKYTNGTNHNPVQLGWILDYELIQSTVRADTGASRRGARSRPKKTGLDTSDCWQSARGTLGRLYSVAL